MRRHLLGVIALLLIVGAVAFWIWPLGVEHRQLEAACWRLGALVGVLWLAYPEVHRLPVWFWAMLPVLVIVLARWPRYFLLAIPLLVVLAILKPRLGRRKE